MLSDQDANNKNNNAFWGNSSIGDTHGMSAEQKNLYDFAKSNGEYYRKNIMESGSEYDPDNVKWVMSWIGIVVGGPILFQIYKWALRKYTISIFADVFGDNVKYEFCTFFCWVTYLLAFYYLLKAFKINWRYLFLRS